MGVRIRKGEQAGPVVFWWLSDERETDGSEDGALCGNDGEVGRRRRLLTRGCRVFNATQMIAHETPALFCPPRPRLTDHARRAFFASLDAKVEHGGNRPRYMPAGAVTRPAE